MGIDLEVQVLLGTGQGDQREPQAGNREGLGGGSGERNRGLTNRNRMRGDPSQGEWQRDHEALTTKGEGVGLLPTSGAAATH